MEERLLISRNGLMAAGQLQENKTKTKTESVSHYIPAPNKVNMAQSFKYVK
jgi:hypothetical protein